MNNIQYLNKVYNLLPENENYKTVSSYITPYGTEKLLSNDSDYAVIAATLRGYYHLMNKIPHEFCGNVFVPEAFENVLIPFKKTNTVSNIESISQIHIEPQKPIRYDFSVIDGKKNSVYCEIKKADTLSFRKQNNIFILEEARLIKRAVDDKLNVQYIIYTNKSALIADNTIACAKLLGIPCFSINDGLMGSLVQTRPVPHELALCIMPDYSINDISSGNESTILIADNIENPDNLGLIIRTADACGADAVISIGRQASIYNKNCQRAARGAIGRFPVFEYDSNDLNSIITLLKEKGYRIFGSSAKTNLTAHNTDDISLRAFVVSNETFGISNDMAKAVDEMIKIPMATGQSSFNVAVAAGIILSCALKFPEQ